MGAQHSYPARQCLYHRGILVFATGLCGCGILGTDPNWQTWWQPDVNQYSVAGALTQGTAARPVIGYVQGEGDHPDPGSFVRVGSPDAGISSAGVYVPSRTIPLSSDRRFAITFTTSRRFAVIRLFAWDDVRDNKIRDIDENLAGMWEIKKEDQRGWSFNAPAWNQFNFTFFR